MKNIVKTTLVVAGVWGVMSAPTMAGASWTESVSLKGDARLRYEFIDQDGKKERNRARVRARVGLKGKVNEEVTVKLRLVSGGGDPVSTNQSFDGAAGSKGFQLDRASVVFKSDAVEGLTVEGGKMGNAFRVVKDLMWDSDLSPEGAFASYKQGALDFVSGAFWLEESSSGRDIFMYGGLLSLGFDLSEDVSLKAGVGYYLYDGLKGNALLVDDDAFGNSTVDTVDAETEEVTSSVYAEDYAQLQGYVVLKADVGMPLKVWADYVTNVDAGSSEDTAYQVGVSLGKAKKPGSFELGYYWAMKEADSLYATWTDSDFGGGGTDVEGSKMWAKLAVMDSVTVGASVFVNEIGLTGSGKDYTRAQFDLVAKF